MGYNAASGWKSYRVPRYPSNWSRAVEPPQNSDVGSDVNSDDNPSKPFYFMDPDQRRHFRILDLHQDDNPRFIESSATVSEPFYYLDNPRYIFLSDQQQNRSKKLTATVQEKKPAQPKCTACWTELDESTTPMPCGHYWCSSCIVRRFTKIRNQTDWPVRCHQTVLTDCTISLDTAKPFLQDEDIRRLIPLIEELETPVMDRVYCSNNRCGIFIARRDTQDRIARCEACQTDTCSTCKGAAHESDNCPLPNQDEQKVLITSHKEGWKRCTGCGQMCERILGCSRIACLCGYRFCYHCAGPINACNGCPEIEYGDGRLNRMERRQRKRAQPVSSSKTDFKNDFTAFTTRRARARTNGRVPRRPETSYQQQQRLEDANFAVMMAEIHQRQDAERAQLERFRAERARRKQQTSIGQKIGRKIQRLCGRVFGL
ncbi:unnamed protein product [Aureobasidium mustum]|uniref:RBR-type E3 ubiquitin transferase n=1 Tax=Aureobasidium mustum TaxID=2773714 RepID=A0A9N8KB76_9PEZI|nr:unnamed protein product [Aureobasidium mustum]